MFLLSDYPWMNLLRFLVMLFDHTLAKFVFYTIVSIIFVIIFFRNRSYGEQSPKFKDAEITAGKVTKVIEKVLIFGALGFLVIQLARVYLL